MTIHLPKDLESYIRSKVQSGRYASEEEVVAEALRQLQREDATSAANGEPQPPTAVPVWQSVLEIMVKAYWRTIRIDALEVVMFDSESARRVSSLLARASACCGTMLCLRS